MRIISIYFLDIAVFCNGEVFYIIGNRHFYDDIKEDNKCISAHNNFIKGSDSKVYREKEMLFYNVDINKYYSDINSKYFTFIYKNSTYIAQIEKLMWMGLIFSNNTNFIFILPRIICKYCNIHNRKWCSYIDCWKIRNLNKCFINRYRENVLNWIYIFSLL